MGSKSAQLLKEGLVAEGIRCFRKKVTDGFIPRREDIVIYYGGTQELQQRNGSEINPYREVAQNKLRAFEAFATANLSTVEWTTDPTVALTWNIIVGRRTLTGHSGQGIFIHDKNDGGGEVLPPAPLYTKYQKKTYECRVHVFNGKVIDAQIKRKRTTDVDQIETDPYVRNIHTGWVYCREDFTLPEAGANLAIQAVAVVGLDFGAVDLIYNKHYNQFYILEINTAPGLEGTTLTNYIKEIKNV